MADPLDPQKKKYIPRKATPADEIDPETGLPNPNAARVEEDTWLPYGLEDYLNPADWFKSGVRGIAKAGMRAMASGAEKGLVRAAEKGLAKEAVDVAESAAPKAAESIISKLRNMGWGDDKIKSVGDKLRKEGTAVFEEKGKVLGTLGGDTAAAKELRQFSEALDAPNVGTYVKGEGLSALKMPEKAVSKLAKPTPELAPQVQKYIEATGVDPRKKTALQTIWETQRKRELGK